MHRHLVALTKVFELSDLTDMHQDPKKSCSPFVYQGSWHPFDMENNTQYLCVGNLVKSYMFTDKCGSLGTVHTQIFFCKHLKFLNLEVKPSKKL